MSSNETEYVTHVRRRNPKTIYTYVFYFHEIVSNQFFVYFIGENFSDTEYLVILHVFN